MIVLFLSSGISSFGSLSEAQINANQEISQFKSNSMEDNEKMNDVQLFKIHLQLNNPVLEITNGETFNSVHTRCIDGKMIAINFSPLGNSNFLDDLNSQLPEKLQHAQDLESATFTDFGFQKGKSNAFVIDRPIGNEIDLGDMSLIQLFVNKCAEFTREKSDSTRCVVFLVK